MNNVNTGTVGLNNNGSIDQYSSYQQQQQLQQQQRYNHDFVQQQQQQQQILRMNHQPVIANPIEIRMIIHCPPEIPTPASFL